MAVIIYYSGDSGEPSGIEVGRRWIGFGVGMIASLDLEVPLVGARGISEAADEIEVRRARACLVRRCRSRSSGISTCSVKSSVDPTVEGLNIEMFRSGTRAVAWRQWSGQ